MGTAKSTLFTVSGALMICAGLGGLITAILIVIERFSAAGASIITAVIAMAVTAVYSIADIAAGITALRKYNRRINSSVIIRIPEICICLCVVSLILNFFNGIRAVFAVLLILTGLVIPLIFIFSAVKKSYY